MSEISNNPQQAVAVIGIGLRLPKANNIEEFWSHLEAQRSLISEIPSKRLDLESIQVESSRKKIWGGFIDDADCFDASFFEISPKEASFMDPQQRFGLEMAWHAIEDAGYKASELAGSNIGVFMGVCHWDYAELLEKYFSATDAYMPTGIAYSIISNRISHFFDFRGPSITNDTACAASMTSIYEAVRSLENGECDMALAGGVNLIWSPNHFSAFSQAGMLSSVGKSQAFDAQADGYVRGEGGGVLLLKPLKKALEDKDPIHGLIRGIGVNHGGRTNSLTVTNPDAQAQLIASVYRRTNVSPSTVSYIEAHGPGTPLGDPIEINGLKQAFNTLASEFNENLEKSTTAIGSVKTNIGHLEGAAGVAGVLKVLAAIKYEKIPANVGFKSLNPMIDLQETPFYIAESPRDWKRGIQARRAGVSSFGFGGSNAHILLEDFHANSASDKDSLDQPLYIALSAKNLSRLEACVSNLLIFLNNNSSRKIRLIDLAYTYQVAREAMAERVVFQVTSLNELIRALTSYLEKENDLCILDSDNCAASSEWIQNWIKGTTDKFEQLLDKSARRISLPKYPFKRERHWIDMFSSRKSTLSFPHPLLQKNVSNTEQLVFETLLSGDELIWAEHKVNGKQVLPGCVYIEMIYSALRLIKSGSSESVRIMDFVILRPVILSEHSIRLQTHLKEDSQGFFTSKIILIDHTGNESTIVQAKLGGLEKHSLTTLNLHEKKNSLVHSVDVYTIYEKLVSTGMEHGSTFQVLRQIRRSGREILAHLKLTRKSLASLKSMPLHPILLDGAIQAWAGFERAASLGAMVPFALESMEIYQPFQAEMWAHVNELERKDSTSLSLNIELYNRQGELCVKLNNLNLRPMKKTLNQATEELIFVSSSWHQCPLVHKENRQKDFDLRLYVLGQIEAVSSTLSSKLRVPVRSLPLDLSTPIGEQVKKGFDFLQAEIQNWMRSSDVKQTEFCLLISGDISELISQPLLALLKTANLENPKFRASLISFSSKCCEPDFLLTTIKQELTVSHQVRELRYDDNFCRYARLFKGEHEISIDLGKTIDPRAVYLLTGGAGGLGEHLTNWLVEKGARKILWLGRKNSLSVDQKSQIRDIKSQGVEIKYQVCDISSSSQLESIFKWCKESFGPIKGIFHAAGVVQDSYIFNNDLASSTSVFSPKLDGLIKLDMASLECKLEFFVLCSSIAASFGNIAQGSYSAANAFMNAYAAYRNELSRQGLRHGRCVSIGWPLWAEGGMSVDLATLRTMQKRWGIQPLPKEIALSALDKILSNSSNSGYTLMYGEPIAISNFLEDFGVDKEIQGGLTPTGSKNTTFTSENLKGFTTELLKDIFSEVLHLETDSLRVNRKLEEYGLESISIVEATTKLEEIFGPLSKTLLFEYVDLKGLIDYFCENHATILSELSGEAVSQGLVIDEVEVVSGSSSSETTSDRHDIAIVGMSIRVSKANNPNELWQMLSDGIDGFEAWPESRWNHKAILHSERDVLGKTVVKTGAFLDDIDKFDPRYFRISQSEAETMSPEVRFFLQASVHAFEDAGYSREYMQNVYGGDVAVIMGSMTNEYDLYGFQNMLVRGARASGSYTGTVPNMVSYYYGFTGPSYFLDTMCSASSSCVHEAVHMLRAGRCKMALAGGVSLLLHPQKLIATSQEHFTSKTAEVIRGYGLGADGTILGEGGGALVLKTLADAKRDGDHIYGVIKGTAISNAGVRNGFTVPNPTQQARAISDALDDAQIDPSTIGYVEGHGSGTALGDPIEVRALSEVYGKSGLASCPLGTVKSNVAHLLAASGLAGICKVLMQFKHGSIAPSLHAKELNSDIDFEKTPFFIPQKLMEWKPKTDDFKRQLPRRAAVTSIGAGGMNSHIVLEEFVDASSIRESRQLDELVVLSAMNSASLDRVVERFCQFLEVEIAVKFSDIAHSLQVGKNELSTRLCFIASSHSQALEKLREYQLSKDSHGLFYVESIFNQDPPDEPQKLEQALASYDRLSLARFWSLGTAIDWRKLNRGFDTKRISLPSYPFEKVRCWYEDYPDAPSVLEPLGNKLKLHPLVGRNLSDLNVCLYETDLYLEEMKDYVFKSNRSLILNPFSAVEASVCLASISGFEGNIELSSIRLLNPSQWKERSLLQYELKLTESGDLKIDASISSENELWFEARLTKALAQAKGGFDLNRIDQKKSLAKNQIYNRLMDRGLDFKPYLQVIEQLYELDERVYLARLVDHPVEQNAFKKNMHLTWSSLAAAAQLLELLSPGWYVSAECTFGRASFSSYPVKYLVIEENLSGFNIKFLGENGELVSQLSEIVTKKSRDESKAFSSRDSDNEQVESIHHLSEVIRQLAADILKFPADQIEVRQPFYELGFDSISFTQYAQDINRKFQIDLSPAIFFECTHIEALAQHLKEHYRPNLYTLKEKVPHKRETYKFESKKKVVSKPTDRESIAILGMAGRFPGANTLDEFFLRLLEEKDLVGDFPINRYPLSLAKQFSDAKFVKKGGFLSDIDLFDASYFKISPLEANLLDPQQRLLLETVIHCIDDAGYSKDELPKSTGVFVGVSSLDYNSLLQANGVASDGYIATGNSLAMLANRISYFLGVHGPSLAIDTACSSSLVAVSQAISSLNEGSCEMAIVAGVNLCLARQGFEAPLNAGMLSPSGRCYSFAEAADGYVRAEGVAAIILKKTSHAIADKDAFYAKIIGHAHNHGGRAGSLTAPNVEAQAQLIETAMSGIDPNSVSYVEAHGTGTQLGDAVELRALRQAYSKLSNMHSFEAPFVFVGSLKSNIGHLEAAAGIAGLIKVVLSMKNKKLPKSLHSENLNPYLELEGSCFKILQATTTWKAEGRALLRAGVSSFGFGGANAHVVLEDLEPSYQPSRVRLAPTKFERRSYWLESKDHLHPVVLKPEWDISLVKNSSYNKMRVKCISINRQLTSKASTYEYILSGKDFSENYISAAKFLLNKLKQIILEDSQHPILLQVVLPDISQEDGYLSGLSAMVESAVLEASNIRSQFIYCDRTYSPTELSEMLGLEASSLDRYVRYHGSQRYVRNYKEVTSSNLKPLDGVVLITGGFGGVGFELTKSILSANPKAKLILTGRSKASHEKLSELASLQRKGYYLEYHILDVSNSDSLSKLITHVITRHGRLNHILHAAGIIRDSLIHSKREEDIDEVFQAKVSGTLALVEATRFIAIDSLVLFSSLAGITGNLGQCDYAAANGFMDAFAQRLPDHVVSINWPYWESGGMKMTSLDFQRLNSEMGQEPLKTEVGYRALQLALASNDSQLIVVDGQKEKIIDFFTSRLKQSYSTLTANKGPGAESKLQEAVESSLRVLFSKVSGVESRLLESDVPLEDFGIDSLMITNLNVSLSRHFNSLSKTLFFRSKTLSEVASYLLENHYDACCKWVAHTPSVSLPVVFEHKSEESHAAVNLNEPIAIVGISGIYPGCNNYQDLWEYLTSQDEVISEISGDRWSLEGFYEADTEKAIKEGKSYTKQGAFLKNFADFDPLFFKISPREAAAMDPQERLFLMASWQALENAGYSLSSLKQKTNSQVGVFVGVCKNGYALHAPYKNEDGVFIRPTSSFASVANRVSHAFDLTGPSIPFDTMCSSSLTAIHEACEYLRRNPDAMALAGGVNLYLHPSSYVELCASRMLSPDGVCKSFGEGANGFVPGEGVGCLLLKPISAAIRDQDNIHAVIRGSAINHGGHNYGYTVPSPKAQADVISKALKNSGVNAEDISYVEAHGTGTALGDPIEVDGLTQAFGNFTDKKGFCAIGSLKSVLGHLEAAAGIAGLTKVVLQLQHRKLTPSRHAEKLNANIDWQSTPLKLQTRLSDWESQKPRLAGISSFGAGGANAHLVIEEAPRKACFNESKSSELVILSAKTVYSLEQRAKQLISYLNSSFDTLPDEPRDLVDELLQIFADLLEVGSHELCADEALDTLGLDAHHWISLENILNERYRVNLDHKDLSVRSSIGEIASQLKLATNRRSEKTPISLSDLAYTLQVGREPMEYRVGFVVDSILDLKSELETFLANSKQSKQVLDQALAVTMKNLLGTQTIETIVEEHWQSRRLDKLLVLWQAGISINWRNLARTKVGRILSLPVYPFDTQSYWRPVSTVIAQNAKSVFDLDGDVELLIADQNFEAQLAGLVSDCLEELDSSRIIEAYQPWYAAMLELLSKHLEKTSTNWQAWISEDSRREQDKSRINLAKIALRNLSSIVTGEKKATAVFFPDGSVDAVEAVYKQNPIAERFSLNTAKAVGEYLKAIQARSPNTKIRILEIGAGTGGTSQHVFHVLKAFESSLECYCYSDISRRFLLHAQKHFAEIRYLETEVFDVEKPVYQGQIQQASFDLIIAANVLHATTDIVQTLKNVRSLMKPQGLLILNETSKASIFTHITFGLLDGWWRFKDPKWRIPGTPSLSSNAWKEAMSFSGFKLTSVSKVEEQALGQQILAAEACFVDANEIATESQTKEIFATDSLEQALRSSLSRILGIDESKLRKDQAFSDLGLDSILGSEWIRCISSELAIKLDQSLLYDFKNLSELTSYIETHDLFSTLRNPIIQENKQARDEELRNQNPRDSLADSRVAEPIAVVGMSGRFAGSDNIDELWNHLLSGDDLVSEPERFDLSMHYPADTRTSIGSRGSFIKNVDRFDSVFFSISGLEATYMDPQQRLFLEEAWKTLEHAGHAGDEIVGSNCGVFVGCSHGDYHELFSGDEPGQAFWGNTSSLIPARISYMLDLKGPALSIDTACSSSLVAVHKACQSIRSGECDLALAGGVFIQSGPRFFLSANKAQMLSPSGRCAAFGADADGIVPGEAVACVLLKPLSKAIAERDTIHGVIIGSGVNQDGATNGITAPSAKSQERLIRKVYEEYRIDPSTIGMIEAHGTGTPLGDPIEFRALSQVFHSDLEKPIFLGSIKSNIGHATTAAGICGLVKALKSLTHEEIPASLHANIINPSISLENTPFIINSKTMKWHVSKDEKRRVAINSFGFSGTNSHMVVEQSPQPLNFSSEEIRQRLFVVSARSDAQLKEQVENLVSYLELKNQILAQDVAYTLAVGRRHFSCRIAIIANSLGELKENLRKWLAGHELSAVFTSRKVSGDFASHLENQANVYLDGGKLDVEALFSEVERRIPLPTYPFLNKSYWVNQKSNLPVKSDSSEYTSESFPSADLKIRLLSPPNVTEPNTNKHFMPFSLMPLPEALEQNKAQMEVILEQSIAQVNLHSGECIDLLVLQQKLIEIEENDTILVIIIRGWQTLRKVNGNELSVLSRCKLPVVALLDGLITTSAFLVAMDADFVFASTEAIFDLEKAACFTNYSFLSAMFSAESLANLNKGKVFCRDLKVAGCSFSVIDSNELENEVSRLAEAIAESPRVSIELLKKHLRHDMPSFSLDDSIQFDSALRGMIEARQLDELSPYVEKEIPLDSELMRLYLSDEGIVHLQMLDSSSANSFSDAFMDGLEEAFQEVSKLVKAKVLILSGLDRYFAVGGTSDGLKKLQQGKTRFTDRKIYTLALECKIPVIAAMRGHAIGAGWSMGMFADLIILAKESVYHSNYMWFGFTPGAGASLVIPIRLGQQLGREVLFSAREYRGKSLKHRAKWLNVVSSKDLLLEAKKMALALCSYSKEELMRAKNSQSSYVRNLIDRVLEKELALHKTSFVGNQQVGQRIEQKFSMPPMKNEKSKSASTQDIRGKLIECLAEELMISTHEIDDQMSFSELGLDSILAVTWIRNLNEKLGLRLPATIVYSTPNLAALVKQLESPPQFKSTVASKSLDEKTTLKELVLVSLSEELMIDRKEIQGDQSFVELGLDSILAVTWIRKLNQLLSLNLPATLIYSSPNLSRFIESLSKYEFVSDRLNSVSNQTNHTQDDAKKASIRQLLISTLAEELMIDADQIQDDASFVDLGLDSILAVTWLRRLNRQLGLDLEATLLYSSPNLSKLLEAIRSHIKNEDESLPLSKPDESIIIDHKEASHRDAISTFANASDHEHLEAKDAILRDFVVSSLAEELMIDTDQIQGNSNFVDLGLDSILAVTWLRRLNQELGLELTVASFYSSPRLDKFLDSIRALKSRSKTSSNISSQAFSKDKMEELNGVRTASASADSNTTQAIAIVGASGAFPKASNLDEYWLNLKNGINCISVVEKDRWELDRYYHPDPSNPDTSYCKWMGRLENIEGFDPGFFNITPREATLMDPQQRLFLMHAWHAIENAGIDPLSLAGSNCGVYASAGDSGYPKLIQEKNAYSLSGNSGSILSSRISYFLDLRGPSLSIDTACSSSLVGLVEACQALSENRCDSALVGGVNIMIGPDMFIDTSKVSMLSKSGQCYTFDERADGFVPGEGVGVLFLKRLEDAQKDGDPIRAVVRAWGSNQDGRTNGITAPNPEAQAALIRATYDRFGIEASSIGLLECHGTGTALGDPIEIEGLNEAFFGVQRSNCHVGSAKSNIGHLLAAAGVAGAMKAMLCLEHHQKPPLIHFKNCNPHIDFSKTPFMVNTKLEDWTISENQKRRVGVSSFGFSGTNAHVVLEQAPVKDKLANTGDEYLFVLSSKSSALLEKSVAHILSFVKLKPDLDLASFSQTLQLGRSSFSSRLCFVYRNYDDLVDYLLLASQNRTKPGLYRSEVESESNRNLTEYFVQGKYSELAKLWVNGGVVDWSRSNLYSRMAIPGNPFDLKNYWVKAKPPLEIKPSEERVASKSVQRSRLGLNWAKGVITEWPEVRAGHMPSLVYPELARGYIEQEPSDQMFGFKHLLWGEPASLEDLEKGLNIVVSEDEEGFCYRIVSEENLDCAYHVAEQIKKDELPTPPEALELFSSKWERDWQVESYLQEVCDSVKLRSVDIESAYKVNGYLLLHLVRKVPGQIDSFGDYLDYLSMVTPARAISAYNHDGLLNSLASLSICSIERFVKYGRFGDQVWLKVDTSSSAAGSNMYFFDDQGQPIMMLENLYVNDSSGGKPILLDS